MKAIYAAVCVVVMSLGCAQHSPTSYTGAGVWKIADEATKPTSDLLVAIQTAKQIVQTNIENADTTGWKRLVCTVEGGKARVVSDLQQGSMTNTGRPLDVAISGKGFFAFKTPTGMVYTRYGNLFVNDKSQLVAGMGEDYVVEPPITFPPNVREISISQDGVIFVMVADETVKKGIGQIQLAIFINPEMLTREGQFFLESKASGEAHIVKPGVDGAGRCFQNFLERSNVDLVREKRRMQFLNEWLKAIK